MKKLEILPLVVCVLVFGALTALFGVACNSATSDATSDATKPHTYGVAGGAPGQIGPFVFPPSWQQATWYIDPQNGSGCASDNNRTCSLSTCGTSGDGPCVTYQSVANRWGTYHPRLAQNTTLTFMTGATTQADPIMFDPYVESGATVSVVGTLLASNVGTLSAVVAKNRSTPQLLNATFGATFVPGYFIVNSTHSSSAWVNAHVSGTTYAMSQPLQRATAPVTPGMGATYGEVDSWASGDSWTLYNPNQIALVECLPTIEPGGKPVTFVNVTVGTGTAGTVTVNEGVGFIESRVTESTLVWSVPDTPNGNLLGVGGVLWNSTTDYWISGGSPGQGVYAYGASPAQSPVPYVYGGILSNFGGSVNGTSAVNGLTVDFDTIITPSSSLGVSINTLSVGLAYVAGSAGALTDPLVTWMNAVISPRNTASIVWGPGQINVNATGRALYSSTSTATATFLNNAGSPFLLNSQTTGCSVNTASPSAIWNCGITITVGALDGTLGASGFGGLATNPGGGTITKYGP